MNIFGNFKPLTYHVLMSINSGAILAVSQNYHILNYLKDLSRDTYLSTFVVNNKIEKKFADELVENEDKYKYTVSVYGKMPKVISSPLDSDKELANLVTQKLICLTQIYTTIENKRLFLSNKRPLAYQEMIYLVKRLEAKDYLEKNCPEDLQKYIYLRQYSQVANVNAKQAAEEILLKSSLADGELSRTEHLRLLYVGQLKKAINKNEVDEILKNFNRDLQFI